MQWAAEREILIPLMKRAFMAGGWDAVMLVYGKWAYWYQIEDQQGPPPKLDRYLAPWGEYEIRRLEESQTLKKMKDIAHRTFTATFPQLSKTYEASMELGWNTSIEEFQSNCLNWFESSSLGQTDIAPPFSSILASIRPAKPSSK